MQYLEEEYPEVYRLTLDELGRLVLQDEEGEEVVARAVARAAEENRPLDELMILE